ncbi:DUF7336 domain-containing protein [Sphingomonas sp. CCH5-D11]|uniref:DUF7336 domain-containing protein n=1 Tax=Sphingomonas sp. CCH5-D11 TaxID=1768786 RepID=UPI000A73F7B5|nr:hypothetical protein [Sphingomonas sp. CCH5-D11]
MTESAPVADISAAAHTSSMEAVFILHHIRSDDEYGGDAKLIGVYRTEEGAQAATERLVSQPGFAEHPDGWHIDRYVIDQDHWEEGFGLAEPNDAPNVR